MQVDDYKTRCRFDQLIS
ncbi:hypothetical protein F383_26573 [Gossypium arboreum]|uniref:Uncharacterized protein n=1 Tax=Gossypium arboreum TaxID=29729 RepID=A0A0B0P265_GOSAR|nr:hypothetical protein F383_26573 [Gossypium arboreum]